MKISRESIFISAIRSFFNTLLGATGVFMAIIFAFIIFSIITPSDTRENFKNKLEILPDLNGSTKILSLNTPAILQIDIHGVIGKTPLTSTEVKYQLLESRKSILKNNRIKGILLHINSPGGQATDSDDIYRNLLDYSKKYNVPIYAYVDGLCASGGFYIACSANKIYTSTMSMIGSVGSLLGPFFNFSKALNEWGIEATTLTEGKNKDMMNTFRPWTKNEDKALVDINDYIYKKFVSIVSNARNIEEDKIINEYGANIFDPQKAKEIGYIDYANTSYDQVLEDLLNEAKIDISKPYQVVTLTPKRPSFLQLFFQMKSNLQSLMKDLILSLRFINSN